MHIICVCMLDQQFSKVTNQEALLNYHWTYMLVFLKIKKPSLSILSIVSWSRSEEGRGGPQMLPELLNKAKSVNQHRKSIKLMIPYFQRDTCMQQLSVVTYTHTNTHILT